MLNWYDLRWQDLADILLVAVLIYQLLLLLRGTQGIQILAGMFVLVLAHGAARHMGLATLEWFLDTFVKSFLLIVIILFQADIRRVLSRVGRRAIFRHGLSAPGALEEIAAAADYLAQHHIGGLMVIERGAKLAEYAEGGIKLEALVTRELLTTLFWPNSPTHDGAVIIQGGQVLAAGCVLPLSRRPGLDKTLGTRHRAALGISELTDALAVVVSEELGRISLAREGRLTPYPDRVQLRLALNDILEQETPRKNGWLEEISRFFRQK